MKENIASTFLNDLLDLCALPSILYLFVYYYVLLVFLYVLLYCRVNFSYTFKLLFLRTHTCKAVFNYIWRYILTTFGAI